MDIKVIESIYGDDGYIKKEHTLKDIFVREITSSDNPLERCAELLSNICASAIVKGQTTVERVSEQVLELESNHDHKNPRLRQKKLSDL